MDKFENRMARKCKNRIVGNLLVCWNKETFIFVISKTHLLTYRWEWQSPRIYTTPKRWKSPKLEIKLAASWKPYFQTSIKDKQATVTVGKAESQATNTMCDRGKFLLDSQSSECGGRQHTNTSRSCCSRDRSCTCWMDRRQNIFAVTWSRRLWRRGLVWFGGNVEDTVGKLIFFRCQKNRNILRVWKIFHQQLLTSRSIYSKCFGSTANHSTRKTYRWPSRLKWKTPMPMSQTIAVIKLNEKKRIFLFYYLKLWELWRHVRTSRNCILLIRGKSEYVCTRWPWIIHIMDRARMPCRHWIMSLELFSLVSNSFLPFEYTEKAENKTFCLTEKKKLSLS